MSTVHVFSKQNHKKRNEYIPWFDTLYEDKIIYHTAGYSFILQLIELDLQHSGKIKGKGRIYKKIGKQVLTVSHMLSYDYQTRLEKQNEVSNLPLNTILSFDSNWFATSTYSENLKSFLGSGFVMWLRPDFVKYIEQLVQYGDNEDTLKILSNK